MTSRARPAEHAHGIDAGGEVAAQIEALMYVEPREFDAKMQRPELAHERCKQPNCSVRPWGLGTVTTDEPRYCAYHEGLNDALSAVRTNDATTRQAAADAVLTEARRLCCGENPSAHHAATDKHSELMAFAGRLAGAVRGR